MKRSILLSAIAALLTSAIVATAQTPGVQSTLNTFWTLVWEGSTVKPTYSATYGAFATASAATDVCTLTGSASKTIAVRRVLVSGINSAIQSDPIAFIKRSTANSGGTAATLTAVPFDSRNAAATATARAYTANPTTGTAVGLIADPYLVWGNLTTGQGQSIEYRFGPSGSAVWLRGTAQVLAVNLGGLTYISGQLPCTFEWTEE